MQTPLPRSEFYQAHLDRVSRSFAFCIRQLPEPLRGWIAVSYLLCRIVDTVEDSAWSEVDIQLQAFMAFDRALQDPSQIDTFVEACASFPASLPESEKMLLRDGGEILRDYHSLSAPVHEIMRELVLSMSQGMQHFCQQRCDGSLRLSTLAEVNQYCFFVAGVVGELLAKLVSRVEPKFRLSNVNVLRAHHFGLFLQKVNLLKDQVGDEKVGRHLIPSRQLVEDSSHENAAHALDFLLDVPKEQIEFRRFCAWSLFLGLEALSVARDSLLRKRVLKVPRAEMQQVLQDVEGALEDDKRLRSLFDRCAQKLGWPKGLSLSHGSVEIPAWMLRLYHGPLDSRSLQELGVTAG